MRDEVVRLRDELRAEEAKTQSWQIACYAAELSCSRAYRERDEAKRRVSELEAALSSVLCAAETMLMGDLVDVPGVEVGHVLAGVSRTAGVALRLYDPSSTLGRNRD